MKRGNPGTARPVLRYQFLRRADRPDLLGLNLVTAEGPTLFGLTKETARELAKDLAAFAAEPEPDRTAH